MKHKSIILYIFILFLLSLWGCTQADNSSDAVSAVHKESTAVPITMSYLYYGGIPSDLPLIEKAVNDITRNEIHVEIELKPVSIQSIISGDYYRLLSSGESLDLICIAFQGIDTYVNNHFILPLDDLIEQYGSYISALAEDFPLYEGASFQEHIYGISPVMPTYGQRWGLLIKEAAFDEAAIPHKEQYTAADLTQLFDAVKEKHPDTYPVCVLGTDLNGTTSNAKYCMEFDTLGATICSGVLLSYDSTEIVNLFETEEYYQYLKTMHDWYQKGYIYPYAATTDANTTDFLLNDISCCIFTNLEPISVGQYSATFGYSFVPLYTTEGYFPSTAASHGIYWSIPAVSKNPEASMRFLDYMYKNQEIADLLKSGIENIHYIRTENPYEIRLPDGITSENASYLEPLGLYGDRRYELHMGIGASIEENTAWSENNKKQTYISRGYVYDSRNMTLQLASIESILEQYLPVLETGGISDFDTAYRNMLSELEAAGIQEVIADNQKQFDQWLARKGSSQEE